MFNCPSGSFPQPFQLHQQSSGSRGLHSAGQQQNQFPMTNIFDLDNTENSSSNNVGLGHSIYEEQMALATQSPQQIQRLLTRDEAKLAELKALKEQAKDDAEATQQLEKDINDLNQIMEDLTKLVQEQHEMVDSIEEHVEQTLQRVQTGERDLRQAVASNSAKYPAATAAVGGVVLGGPVGLAAGSLIAGVAAAVGGAFAGLYGGRLLKRQTQKHATRSALNQQLNSSS